MQLVSSSQAYIRNAYTNLAGSEFRCQFAVAPRFFVFLGTGRHRVRSPKATDFATDVHLGFRKQGGWTEQLTVRRKSFLDFRPTLHFEKGYSVFSYMIIMIYQVDCRSFGAGQAGGTNIYRSILISERIDGG